MLATKIAHLSDLHFHDAREGSLQSWDVLVSFLTQQQPDLIVVTGDLADGPRKLGLARQKLMALADGLKLPFLLAPSIGPGQAGEAERGLLVIPGNHDVRAWGNASQNRKPWDKAFGAPRERGVWLRKRNIIIYAFDSCGSGALLARGRVAARDLDAFTQWCERCMTPQEWLYFTNALKIALVHHHPIPIADTETGRELPLRAFVSMDNGGQLLRVLGEQGFTLLLHGHDHCPQSSLVETHYIDRENPPLLVVAGGCAAYPRQPPPGHYTLNLIRADEVGNVQVETFVRKLNLFESKRTRPISPWPARRQQAVAFVRSGTEFEFAGITKEVVVDETGSADVRLELKGGQLKPGCECATELSIRLPRAVPGGDFPVDYLTVKAHAIWANGHRTEGRWERAAASRPARSGLEVEGAVCFCEPLPHEAGPFDVEIRYFVPNAMTTTCEQHRVLYGRGDRVEYTSLPLDNVAKRLVLKVVFSGSSAGFPATHELAQVSGSDLQFRGLVGLDLPDGVEPPADEAWIFRHENQRQVYVPAADLPARLSVETRPDPKLQKESCIVALTIENPIPGLRYYLAWNLPSVHSDKVRPSDPGTNQKLGAAEHARNKLLALRFEFERPLASQTAGPFLNAARKQLLDSPLVQVKDEQLEIGLAAYDPAQRRLVFCAGEFQQQSAAKGEAYLPGEGVIGRAFKMKGAYHWYPPRGIEEALARADCLYRKPDRYSGNHEAIIAVPLLHPLENPRAGGALADSNAWRYVIGLLVVRSLQPGTVLIGVMSDELATVANPFADYSLWVAREFQQQFLPLLMGGTPTVGLRKPNEAT